MNHKPFQPIKIFVSYSHADEKYLKRFQEAISNLKRSGMISDEWYDGKIIAGDEFEPVIFQQLNKADIIVLLLSPSYISSRYCWDVEMEEAIHLRDRKNVRVVGIIVREVALTGLDLLKHKLLPKDRKPIPQWHPQDAGWKNVSEGIQQLIADINNPSQVDDAMEVPNTILDNASEAARKTEADPNAQIQPLFDITEFWESRGSMIKPGSMVSIEGTFSMFTPMLMGPPKIKVRLHKLFRQAMESNRLLRSKKGNTLDACLSVSAGQMVYRKREERSPYVYCGLYNSIVRNSIPILVEKEYYDSQVASVFKKHGSKAVEAQVTGRVIELDNSPALQFMNKHARIFRIPTHVADDLCKDVYGLVIDGNKTIVKEISKARYLDGDIWIAVEHGGNERFLTSFLNLSDAAQCEEELNTLLSVAQKLPDSPRIIGQYDQDLTSASEDTTASESNKFFDSIWRFGFGT